MKFVERTDSHDMGASFTGAAIHLESLQGFSINAFWTGTGLTGTLSLQGSNNAFLNSKTSNEEDPNAVWDELPGSAVVVDGNSSFFWNEGDAYFKAARLVWTRTAGTGSLSAYIYAKGWV